MTNWGTNDVFHTFESAIFVINAPYCHPNTLTRLTWLLLNYKLNYGWGDIVLKMGHFLGIARQLEGF